MCVILNFFNRLQETSRCHLSRRHAAVWTFRKHARKLLWPQKRRLHLQVRTATCFNVSHVSLGKLELTTRLHLLRLPAISACEFTVIRRTLTCRTLQKAGATCCQSRGFVLNGGLGKCARCGLVSIMTERCSCTSILQVCD